MRNGINALLFALIVTSAGSCVSFKTATLYDGKKARYMEPVPSEIGLAVEPIVFYDDTRDMWGLQKDECQDASVTEDVFYQGKRAIKIVWDRNAPECVWAGIGIGWDGYAGKDLSSIFDHAAFSFYIRSVEGRMFSLPFVLTLEDYSGGMGFCYTANKYFERTAIDERWQRVIVPLSDFDLETEKLDPTNIKQLQIELQQNGAVYLDQIELVFHTPAPPEAWMEEAPRPDPTALPITLFDSEFINQNGFGIVSDDCQDFRIVNAPRAVKGRAIKAKWQVDDACHLVEFGVSWNRWFPVDMSSILASGAVQFKIKTQNDLPFDQMSIGFEDYDRGRSQVALKMNHIQGSHTADAWATVLIPLKEFTEGSKFTNIKHLFMTFEGEGEVLIDDLQLIRID